MRKFPIEIVTPDGLIYSGEIESVLVRTGDGDVEIMAAHADYMAALGTGRARILTDGNHRYAACSGGFITVSGGKVKLVAVTFEFADEIDTKRAEASRDAAEARISTEKDERALARAKAKLARALNRISVANLK